MKKRSDGLVLLQSSFNQALGTAYVKGLGPVGVNMHDLPLVPVPLAPFPPCAWVMAGGSVRTGCGGLHGGD